MNRSVRSLAILIAGLFVASYLVGFFLQRSAYWKHRAAAPAAAAGESNAAEAPSRASEAPFAQTADRVTMGSGIAPEPATGPLAGYDQLLRRMAALPDGEQKMLTAEQISAIHERAAAPLLLDWIVTTTDRALLRSALEALGPLADAELIDEIERRFAAAFRQDDRYRLAKAVRNITNAEAVPALIDLAGDATAPQQLSVAATEALATVATPPAVSFLLEKVSAASPDDIGRLMTAIARIDRPEVLPALQYAAQGNKDAPSDLARIAAIHALANFHDEPTRALLQRLGTDPSGDVRDAALGALERNP